MNIDKYVFDELENLSDSIEIRNGSVYMPLKTSTFKFGITSSQKKKGKNPKIRQKHQRHIKKTDLDVS